VLVLLSGEPWLMLPEDIYRLDPWVIVNFLLWPRDKDGQPQPAPDDVEPEDEGISQREFFRLHWWRLGLAEWQIDKLWSERGHRTTGNSPG
jgi:hypothetical protein